jgi:hypothetical protein
METIAILVAIFTSIFVAFIACVLPLSLSGIAAQEKALARRIADARMNARLLRFNL